MEDFPPRLQYKMFLALVSGLVCIVFFRPEVAILPLAVFVFLLQAIMKQNGTRIEQESTTVFFMPHERSVEEDNFMLTGNSFVDHADSSSISYSDGVGPQFPDPSHSSADLTPSAMSHPT